MLSTSFRMFFFILLLSVSSSLTAPTLGHKNKAPRQFSGKATWFYPDTGACGDTNVESDSIVAMNIAQYGGACHKTVHIKNNKNGKTATATVTDMCPSCAYGSLDLSPSVFGQLGDLDDGVLAISWDYS